MLKGMSKVLLVLTLLKFQKKNLRDLKSAQMTNVLFDFNCLNLCLNEVACFMLL